MHIQLRLQKGINSFAYIITIVSQCFFLCGKISHLGECFFQNNNNVFFFFLNLKFTKIEALIFFFFFLKKKLPHLNIGST
jgi:hypothetical protein